MLGSNSEVHRMTSKLIRKNILIGAGVIGLFGGIAALSYYFVLQFMLHLIWGRIYGSSIETLFRSADHPYLLVLITSIGGLLIGCSLKWLGKPGEIAAVVDNIHLERGRLDIRQSPSMIVNSLISITAGGSAGPEAPLVQIIGSFGSWLGDRLGLPDEEVRIYTFCGMATALGALFGAPIGGALFALEIPHRRGLEYYEALLPSCVAALVGFLVFRGALGWEAPLYAQPALHAFSYNLLLFAALFGIVGASLGGLFAILFRTIERLTHPFVQFPILLGAVGGALIGLSALYFPETLFWGEYQIQSLLTLSASVSHLFLIAAVKMLTIGFTLHFGFRGGFIFPLFFIGAALGLGISTIFPTIPPLVAMLSLMAALNVAVTKTPISTTMILTALSGANLLPLLAIASFTSFLVSSRVEVIHSQKSRNIRVAA
jgi:H+/Cl- antiporter ClcA